MKLLSISNTSSPSLITHEVHSIARFTTALSVEMKQMKTRISVLLESKDRNTQQELHTARFDLIQIRSRNINTAIRADKILGSLLLENITVDNAEAQQGNHGKLHWGVHFQ